MGFDGFLVNELSIVWDILVANGTLPFRTLFEYGRKGAGGLEG